MRGAGWHEGLALHPPSASAPALGDQTRTLSHGELQTEIDDLARLMAGRGVRPACRVVIQAGNTIEQVLAILASLSVRAVVVPLPHAVPQAQFEAALAELDPAAVILAGTSRSRSVPDSLERVATNGALDLVLRHSQRVRAGEAEESLFPQGGVILYTSGSSAEPRPVMLPQGTLAAAVETFATSSGMGPSRREAVVLPLTHGFGLCETLAVLRSGGFVWVHPGLKPPRPMLKAFRDFAIDAMPLVASFADLLIGPYRDVFAAGVGALKTVVFGAEPLAPEVLHKLREINPAASVVYGYGLTEALRAAHFAIDEPLLEGCVGWPSPACEIRIGSDAAGCSTKGGGEILIRGPQVMRGYWRRPEATQRALQDGWLRTGDVGWIDGEGRLFLAGRQDERIKAGGVTVSAREIEATLRAHPRVVDAAVAAMPDGLRGQSVGALIVGGANAPSDREIRRWCLDQLTAPAAVPRRILFVPAIPRSESGKIRRGVAAAMLGRDVGGPPDDYS